MWWILLGKTMMMKLWFLASGLVVAVEVLDRVAPPVGALGGARRKMEGRLACHALRVVVVVGMATMQMTTLYQASVLRLLSHRAIVRSLYTVKGLKRMNLEEIGTSDGQVGVGVMRDGVEGQVEADMEVVMEEPELVVVVALTVVLDLDREEVVVISRFSNCTTLG